MFGSASSLTLVYRTIEESILDGKGRLFSNQILIAQSNTKISTQLQCCLISVSSFTRSRTQIFMCWQSWLLLKD